MRDAMSDTKVKELCRRWHSHTAEIERITLMGKKAREHMRAILEEIEPILRTGPVVDGGYIYRIGANNHDVVCEMTREERLRRSTE
jgi:hypothetical protein